MSANARTHAATEAAKDWHAQRAVDDPVKLAKAARIVRAALARKRLSLVDLAPIADDRQEPEARAA